MLKGAFCRRAQHQSDIEGKSEQPLLFGHNLHPRPTTRLLDWHDHPAAESSPNALLLACGPAIAFMARAVS
jgi:hypothetical protein